MKFQLEDDFARELYDDRRIVERGKEYFIRKKYKLVDIDYENQILDFVVFGTEEYKVTLFFSDRGEIFEGECTCPAYSKYEGCCKHVIAGSMAAQLLDVDRFEFTVPKIRVEKTSMLEEKRLKRQSEERNKLLFRTLRHVGGKMQKSLAHLELSVYRDQFYSSTVFSLEIRIGAEKLYKVSAMSSFLDNYNHGRTVDFGKYFTFNPLEHEFIGHEKEVMELLAEIRSQELISSRGGYYAGGSKGTFQGKKIYVSERVIKKIFQIYKDNDFSFYSNDKPYILHGIKTGAKLPMSFQLVKKDENYNLILPQFDTTKLVTSDGEYILIDEEMYRLNEGHINSFMPLYDRFLQENKNSIIFSGIEKSDFMTLVMPKMKNISTVILDKEIIEETVEAELTAKVYLNKSGYGISAKLVFDYGIEEFNPFAYVAAANVSDSNVTGQVLIRDMEKEGLIIAELLGCGFQKNEGKLYLEDEEEIFQFLNISLSKLQESVELYYSEDFRNIVQGISKPFKIGVRLESNDLLEFSFNHDEISGNEIKDILKAIKYKKKYYRLKNGGFLSLEEKELKLVADMVESLDLKSGDFDKKAINLPKYRALYLDAQLKELGLTHVDRNQGFKQLVQSIKEPMDMDFAVSENLENIMRGYQKTGYKWLKTLAEYGMGGILADDMGLGKTIQAISFIESLEKGSKCLVIAPTSLIYNWRDEVEKFAPELKVLIVEGTPTNRAEMIAKVDEFDIVVTSYPLIRRDIHLFEKIRFEYCFIDEAQHIKNPRSMNAKVVKKINSKGRFALTGTPIENSLSELWSIFDFVMPGYLHKHDKFMEKFERPIAKDGDPKAMKRLGQMVEPFLLRRLKKDVLAELPEKIETRMLSELTDKQKMIYLAYLSKAREDIAGVIGADGFDKSRVKIFSILTRLRQICCHPGMFVSDYHGGSGKLEQLEEVLEEALEGGHRVLLFSQFTSMLAIIRDSLVEKGIEFLYLDGKTPVQERGKLVKSFNEGAGQVFLISLKAGGTGLNLTGADMVIHFDPWWNPAVEDQATDRAHRIGQKKVVQVFKLITKGTIEEKVYLLQQKKKDLTDAIIKPGETFISKLSENEILGLFEEV